MSRSRSRYFDSERDYHYNDSDSKYYSERSYSRRRYSNSPERRRKYSNSPIDKRYDSVSPERYNSPKNSWSDSEECIETMSIILKNLDFDITEDSIRTEIFKITQIGPSNITILKDKYTRKCTGIGFLDFDSLESCNEALKLMIEFGDKLSIGNSKNVLYKKTKPLKKKEYNEKEWICSHCTAQNYGHGNKCRMCHKRKIEKEEKESCELIIRGLDETVTEKTLYESFSIYAEPIQTKVVRDYITRESKGYGFIEYSNTKEACLVKENSIGLKINGFEVTIGFSKRLHVTEEEKYVDKKIENWKSFYDYKMDENDGKTGYILDEKSGYYYNSKLKYYFDPTSGYYFDTKEQFWMYFNSDTKEYIKCEKVEEDKKDEVEDLVKKTEEGSIKNEQFEKWKKKSKEIEQESHFIEKQIIKKESVDYNLPNVKSSVKKDKVVNKSTKKVRRTQKLLGLNSKTAKLVKSGKLIIQQNLEDKPIESSNIGNKMLKMMGYKEGEGLGKKSDGIVEPIKVEKKDNSKGIGFQKSYGKVGDSKKLIQQMRIKERYDSLK
eukprot:gene5847-9670_t